MTNEIIHIMWDDKKSWCGIEIRLFKQQAGNGNLPTCKRCLKSPFSAEFYTSQELDTCYSILYDKYVARFNIPDRKISKKIAILLLEQAKLQV